jgi:hypothetical protein
MIKWMGQPTNRGMRLQNKRGSGRIKVPSVYFLRAKVACVRDRPVKVRGCAPRVFGKIILAFGSGIFPKNLDRPGRTLSCPQKNNTDKTLGFV